MSLLPAHSHLTNWVTSGEPPPLPESGCFICDVTIMVPASQDSESQIRCPVWRPRTGLHTVSAQLAVALIFLDCPMATKVADDPWAREVVDVPGNGKHSPQMPYAPCTWAEGGG